VCRQNLPSKIPALKGTGPERFYDDVGVLNELEKQRLTSTQAEVKSDASLVTRVNRPEEVVTVLFHLTPSPQWIRPIRRLNLYYVGTHISH
jgi:hypothetical protein